MAKFHFSLVSPERELYSALVDQVDASGVEGDFANTVVPLSSIATRSVYVPPKSIPIVNIVRTPASAPRQFQPDPARGRADEPAAAAGLAAPTLLHRMSGFPGNRRAESRRRFPWCATCAAHDSPISDGSREEHRLDRRASRTDHGARRRLPCWHAQAWRFPEPGRARRPGRRGIGRLHPSRREIHGGESAAEIAPRQLRCCRT